MYIYIYTYYIYAYEVYTYICVLTPRVQQTGKSTIILRKSKLDFNSMWTENLQIFKLDLDKAEEPEIKLPTSIGS